MTGQAAMCVFLQVEKTCEANHTAAKAGSIHAAYTSLAEFTHQNRMVKINGANATFRASFQVFLFLGTNWTYALDGFLSVAKPYHRGLWQRHKSKNSYDQC